MRGLFIVLLLELSIVLHADAMDDSTSVPVDSSSLNISSTESLVVPDTTVTYWDYPSKLNPRRLRPVVITSAALYTGAFIGLDHVWYSQFDKAPMHSYNDWGEWNNMDKLGHCYAGYFQTRIMTDVFRWTGLSKNKSIWYGGLCGAAFQSIVEVLDGYNEKWGFSWPDMAANFLGVGIAMGQVALWDDQRIQLKFSAHIVKYPTLEQSNRIDSLHGTGTANKLLKDYNGQTYWYSVNPSSFLPESRLPRWLNVSIGVGAGGLFGGYKNEWEDKWDGQTYTLDVPRYTEWYLSPDIDFTKIKTNRKGVKLALYLLNIFKVPLPTLQYDTQNGLKFHTIYF